MAYIIRGGSNSEPMIFNTEQELANWARGMGFQYSNGTLLVPQPDNGIPMRYRVTQENVNVPTYSVIDNNTYQGGQLPTLVVRGKAPTGVQRVINELFGSGNPIWGSNRTRGVARLERNNPEYAQSLREANTIAAMMPLAAVGIPAAASAPVAQMVPQLAFRASAPVAQMIPAAAGASAPVAQTMPQLAFGASGVLNLAKYFLPLGIGAYLLSQDGKNLIYSLGDRFRDLLTRAEEAEVERAHNAAQAEGETEQAEEKEGTNPEQPDKNQDSNNKNQGSNNENPNKKPGRFKRAYQWVKDHPKISGALLLTVPALTRESVTEPLLNYGGPAIGNAVTKFVLKTAPFNIPAVANDSTDLWWHGGVGLVKDHSLTREGRPVSNEEVNDNVPKSQEKQPVESPKEQQDTTVWIPWDQYQP